MSRENYRVKAELREAKEKLRICLKCSTEFKSSGPGNRLCTNCAASNQGVRQAKPVSPVSRRRIKSIEGLG